MLLCLRFGADAPDFRQLVLQRQPVEFAERQAEEQVDARGELGKGAHEGPALMLVGALDLGLPELQMEGDFIKIFPSKPEKLVRP